MGYTYLFVIFYSSLAQITSCTISSITSESHHYNHRQLRPFNPDPGGNVSCAGSGDPICTINGVCVADWLSQTNWTCHCDKGWFTRHQDTINHDACSTKQPQYLVALLLQIFLGWISVGAFYLGWNIYATISFMVSCWYLFH